jgi:S1-C subfamily serine protease
MKIKAGTVITRYNGKPVMTEQELYLQENGQP